MPRSHHIWRYFHYYLGCQKHTLAHPSGNWPPELCRGSSQGSADSSVPGGVCVCQDRRKADPKTCITSISCYLLEEMVQPNSKPCPITEREKTPSHKYTRLLQIPPKAILSREWTLLEYSEEWHKSARFMQLSISYQCQHVKPILEQEDSYTCRDENDCNCTKYC